MVTQDIHLGYACLLHNFTFFLQIESTTESTRVVLQMVPSCGGAGDSSESHDTDPPGDELDSPPTVRRRPPHGKLSRPHSDLLNQILIDKFKVSQQLIFMKVGFCLYYK